MSLIEVLISVLILAIGMLGIAAMQAAALRNSQSSLQQSQAVIEANSILDAMRANLTVARANGYNMGMAAAPCTPPAAGATLVTNDQNWWITNLQSSMGPGACGSVACAANVCNVTVKWNTNLNTTGDTTSIVSQL
jgi:type IV pilus assembly protein PilV